MATLPAIWRRMFRGWLRRPGWHRRRGWRPTLTPLEDRTLPAAFGALVAAGDLDADGHLDVVAGAGPDGAPRVRAFSGRDGSTLRDFFAYDPAARGGVSVAAGDLDGDGYADLVTGAGPGGGPHVKVFSGKDGSPLRGFFAFDPSFRGGVNVAVGDVTGDGRADLIAGAGPGGGPHVKVFDGRTGAEARSFFAYAPGFAGGVAVAAGDLSGDGVAEVLTGAGPGGGPHVRAFDGRDGSVLRDFFAYDPGFAGGVSVAAGDVDGDGRTELVTGAGPGGGPHVRAFGPAGAAVAGFFAFPSTPLGGTAVAAADADGDGRDEMIAAAADGAAATISLFDSPAARSHAGFAAFESGPVGGFARPASGTIQVPGSPGATTIVRVSLTRETAFANEFGLFRVDDTLGRVNGLVPGADGYAAAALADGRRVRVPSDSVDLTLPAGSYGLYLIQNATADEWVSGNPANRLDAGPRAFFSIRAANPEGYRHSRLLPTGEHAFEDLTGGGDVDFNDLVARVEFPDSPPVVPPVPPTVPPVPPPVPPTVPPTVPPVPPNPPPPPVTPDEPIVLREDDRFRTSAERTLTVPADTSVLRFDVSTAFDGSDTDSVNDAFEAALLDAAGRPLVHTVHTGTDAFLNLTEGEPAATGAGTTFDGRTATVELAGLPAGTTARLVLRLVNNDRDTATSATVSVIAAAPGGSGVQPSAVLADRRARSAAAIDLAALADVTAGLAAEYGRTTFHDDEQVLTAAFALHNRGRDPIRGPLVLAVGNLSDPSVRVRDADGVLPDGRPYYDLTGLLTAGGVAPEDRTGAAELSFFNPGRVPFTYELTVLGVPNRPPAFTSEPDPDAAPGREYRTDADATDPDGDAVTYRLIDAPAGMAIDPAGGVITWTPAESDRGTASVTVEASDGRGGVARQQFALLVDDLPNRPPVITSPPVTDGNVDTPYAYQLVASDRDNDPLTFTLVNGPAGMALGAAGLLSWQPAAGQLGPNDVTVEVSDGRGGTASQRFTVSVRQEPGNHAPVITSEPVTHLVQSHGRIVVAHDEHTLADNGFSEAPDAARFAQNVARFFVGDRPGNFLAFSNNFGLTGSTLAQTLRDAGHTWTVSTNVPFTLDTLSDYDAVFVGGFRADARVLVDYVEGGGNVYLLAGSHGQFVGGAPDEAAAWNTFLEAFGLRLDTVYNFLDFQNQPVYNPHPVFEGVTKLFHNVGQSIIDVDPADPRNAILATDPRPARADLGLYAVYDAGAREGYRYDVDAVDPDGDPLTFSLVSAPAGAVIDPQTGLITFTPPAAGTFDFAVRAADGRGGADTQTFTLTALRDGDGPGAIRGTVFDDQAGPPPTQLLGPTLYLERADSPFDLSGLGTTFFLEDFEDRRFNVPGVKANTGNPFPPTGITDSVDADDGAIDGSGLRGHSYFTGGPLQFTFDAAALGKLPTHAGLVWTDGAHGGTLITFEAFDAQGKSLGTLTGNHGDPFLSGETAEDRFYGVVHAGGISAIRITNQTGGTEIDHLQYGWLPLGGAGQTVYLDRDEDGRRDPDEESAFTDLDGNYALTGLMPGTYTVRLDHAPGFVQTAPAAGAHRLVIADGSEEYDGINFVIAAADPAAIAGTVFDDANGDGDRDAGEPALPGWAVYLDRDEDGARDVDEPSVVADPDGAYSFTGLPAGQYVVAVEPQGGFVQTAPPAPGTHVLTLAAGQAASGHDFGFRTDPNPPPNRAPDFTSTPPTAATVGRRFRYDSAATDPDRDPLSFELLVKPAGMAVDPARGTVVWTPRADQLGEHAVVLRVEDGRGGVDLQAFTIAVALPNTAPVITSTPGGPAAVGRPFEYRVRAQDAEGDAVTFALTSAPAGVAIDPATGRLTWTPADDQAGTHAVTVVATDARGLAGRQTFPLTALAAPENTRPVITSTPRTTTGLAHAYLYLVRASDADGDPLTLELVTAPAGMTMDADGLVRWTPTGAQLGPHPVAVRASDGRDAAEQSFAVTVVSGVVNGPPRIVSAPPAAGTVGRPFAYDPLAVDPDGDLLVWGLDQAPAGMSIDSEFGFIRWTPGEDHVGPQTVTVRATDPLGGTATQTFTVAVRAANTPPFVTSTPGTRAAVGKGYAYAPRGFDPDGDPLTFDLGAAPAGMAIDPATGSITWTPAADQLGEHAVTLRVSDGRGGTAEQRFRVLVRDVLNLPPEITSTPPTTSAVGSVYRYPVVARDPDAGPLTYSVVAGPAGLTIDVAGEVAWAPTVDQGGRSHAVTVRVTDEAGDSATQSFAIDVRAANRAPVLDGPPLMTAAPNKAYQFLVPARDPDGDPLAFTLLRGPAGLTVDPAGRVTWIPTLGDIGTHEVEILIADDRGAEVELAYPIAVGIDAAAPRVQILVSENPVDLGRDVIVQVRATDDTGVTELVLTAGGAAVALDQNGRATLRPDRAGPLELSATAADTAGNRGTARATLFVADPSDPTAPVVTITSPDDGAAVTTFTDVVGSVTDDNLAFYTLSVAPADGPFTEFARGTQPVQDGVLGRFDPTLLENGSYVLRVQAVDLGGNVTTADREVGLTGDLKLGNFRSSFVDLAVPVAGVPITVARTYDTLAAGQSEDLGFGWRLELRDTDLRTSVPKTGDEQDGIFNPFHDRARVTVTLPDGTRQGFRFQPRLRFSLFGLNLFRPEFVPDAGVTGTLTVDQFDLQRSPDGEYFGMSAGGLPYDPADSAFGGRYTLTTKDGTAYRIDGLSGDLQSVTDRNGNRLTFSAAGVTSSAGVGVTFGRDPRGRITSVTDPLGNAVRYGYDAAGDLASVTDREGNVTRFEYRTDRPHFLDRIIDPLGRTGVRTEYGPDGRVARVFDAAGREVQFLHDTAQSRAVVIDPRGNPTTLDYDARGNVVTRIDAIGGVTSSTYDANDNLLTRTDPLGNTTTSTYDGRGNELSTTDPLGNVTRYTYDSFGSVLTATDPLGHTTASPQDRKGNLRSLTFPDGSAYHLAYNESGVPTLLTDPAGTTRFEYDGIGNVVREVDPLGHETKYVYDANGNKLSRTTFRTIGGTLRALTTTYEHDRENRLVATTDPLGGVTRTEYDALGREAARVDALGRRTVYEYDDAGRLVRTTFPDGLSETAAYDAAGNKVSQTDRGGRTTAFVYDALNRLVATIFPDETPADPSDNPAARTVYDAAGRVVAEVDANGHRTDHEYDAAGRRVRTLQSEVVDGRTGAAVRPETRAEYDVAGHQIAVVDPNGRRTEFAYDAAGRLTVTRWADGTATEQRYDAAGRLVAVADQAGATTSYGYDALNRLLSVTLPAPRPGEGPLVTSYTYDEGGNRLTQTDALGRTTRFAYDELGRLVVSVRPGGQSESMGYDAAGNLVRHTDFNGRTTLFSYDALDRLTREVYPDGSAVQFAYTATGQRQAVTDSRGVTSYEYDSRDRLVARTDPDGRAVHYTYDANGNRTSVSVASGTTGYAFDALNRLTAVTAPDAGATRYFYDPAGNQVRAEFPNGTAEARGYDALNRLVVLETRGPAGVLSGYRYTLGPTGLRLAVEEHDGRRVEYAYDGVYRLVRETITDPAAGNRTIAYSHDAVGNRLTRDDSAEGATTYAYDENDRLLTETLAGVVTRYTHDENGNVLTRATDGGGRVGYEWDAEDRLVGVDSDGDGTVDTRYVYDADGVRVARTVGGDETRFLVDANRPYAEVLEEYAPGGVATTTYVHGRDLISQDRGGQRAFHVADGLGSTRALTDGSGQVTDRYAYDAYGRVTVRAGGTPNTYLFAGEQFAPESGLYYLRARYYDPATGRFPSTDPFAGRITIPVSLHDYLYAHDDPVNRTDPSGLSPLAQVSVSSVIQGIIQSTAFHASKFAMNVALRGLQRASTQIIKNRVKSTVINNTFRATQVEAEVAEVIVTVIRPVARHIGVPGVRQVIQILRLDALELAAVEAGGATAGGTQFFSTLFLNGVSRAAVRLGQLGLM